MKQRKMMVMMSALILLTHVGTAKAESWQQTLQSKFEMVDTFDELQDWNANGTYVSDASDLRSYDPSLLPKKLDGSQSRWGYWANKYPAPIVNAISNGPFVAGETVVNGKGAKWEYRKTWVLDGVTYLQLRDPVTGSVGRFYVGDTLIGQTSGATATITGWPNIIGNHGDNSWRGKSLSMNLGDNDNGAGAMAGIGAQRLGTFFGDGITGKSGYKKINIFMMVKFAPEFFGASGGQSDVDYISVFKFLDICSGFTSIKTFGSSTDKQYMETTPQVTTEYGENYSILNLNGGGLSLAGRAVMTENTAVATLTPNSSPVTYYGRTIRTVNLNNNDSLYGSYGNDLNKFSPTLAGGEWFGIEIISDIGTTNNSDGSTELYVYDKNGVVKGHYRATGQPKLVQFDHYYNKITLGGNRRTGSTSSNIDGRYWIDDFVVSGNRIGPTYFQLLGSSTDTTAPTATITSPTGGASVSGTKTVTVNAADNIAVSKVELLVNGAVKATSTAAPYSLAWDSTTVPNGAATLSAKAYDAAGNVGQSAALQVNVSNAADLTAPTVSIQQPVYSATVSGTVPISVAASDNVGVSKVEYYLNGAIFGLVGSAPYTLSWNSTAYANGSYTLTAKAYDAAGNVGTSSSTVTVSNPVPDASAPVISSFTMPATSTSRTVPVTTFAGSDDIGVTGYLISESSVAPSSTTGGWSASAPVSFTFAGEGSRTAYAWCKDASGKISAAKSASVTITLPDTVAPSVTIISPATGMQVRGSVAVNASASDNVAVSKVEFYVNGSLKATSSAAPYSFSWNTLTAPNGAYTVSAKAYDAAGNVGQFAGVSLYVFNDTKAPAVSIASPISGSTVMGTASVSANASDDVGVTKVEFYVNGALQATSTAAPYGFNWNTATVANGSYTLSAKAYDASGNAGQSAGAVVSVFNDTKAPAVSISSPVAGSTVKGTVSVSANASDNVAVTKVEFYLDGALKATSTALPYAFNWNSTTAANGSHTLSTKAYDAAGNIGTATASVNVLNDTVAPVISVISPKTAYLTSSKLTVAASATDNVAVVMMEAYIDNTLLVATNNASFSVAAQIAKGLHTVTIKAYDAAKNVSVVTKSVNRFF